MDCFVSAFLSCLSSTGEEVDVIEGTPMDEIAGHKPFELRFENGFETLITLGEKKDQPDHDLTTEDSQQTGPMLLSAAERKANRILFISKYLSQVLFAGSVIFEPPAIALRTAYEAASGITPYRVVLWAAGSGRRANVAAGVVSKAGKGARKSQQPCGASVVYQTATSDGTQWVERGYRIRRGRGSFRGGLTALSHAIETALQLVETATARPLAVKVFSDCKPALTRVHEMTARAVTGRELGRNAANGRLIAASRRLQRQKVAVELRWVPVGVCLEGMQRAERVARGAAEHRRVKNTE